jgi:hypothetical protein
MSILLTFDLISSTFEDKKRQYKEIKTELDKETIEINNKIKKRDELVKISKTLETDISAYFELQKQKLQTQELEQPSKKKKLNSEVNTVSSTDSMYGSRDRKKTKHFTFHEKGGTNPTPPPVGPKKKPSFHYEEVIPTTDVNMHKKRAYLLNIPVPSSGWSDLSPMETVSNSGMLSASMIVTKTTDSGTSTSATTSTSAIDATNASDTSSHLQRA